MNKPLGGLLIRDERVGECLLPKGRPFVEFFARLVAEFNPDFVVAISRKGPRLLKSLFSSESVFGVPIVCEKAIDFLSDAELKGRKVLLFDDTVIWGSTMELVRRKLCLRGCEVICVSYGVADSFFGEEPASKRSPFVKSLDLNYFERHSDRESNVFCNRIVDVIRGLGKPYDIDYPVFQMKLRPTDYTLDTLERTWLHCLSRIGKTYSVTTAAHRLCGVLAFSVLAPLNAVWFPLALEGGEVVPDVIQKCRFFVNTRDSCVNVVPLALLRWEKPALPKFKIALGNSTLHHLVSAITAPKVSHSDAAIFGSEALFARFRALLFTHNLLYGTALIKEFVRLRTFEDLVLDDHFELDKIDLGYLFGPSLGKQLLQLESVLTSSTESFKDYFSGALRQPLVHPEIDSKDVYHDFRSVQCQSLEEAGFPLKLDSEFDVEENLNRICRSLYYVIDKNRREAQNVEDILLRLRRGLSYSDLFRLLKETGIELNVDTFSHAIDVFNDCGSLVPINILIEDRVFVRGCRNGEDDRGYLSLRLFVREALTWQKKQGVNLSRSAFHKVFVILSQLYPNALPLGSAPERMGPIAVVKPALQGGGIDLIKYLTRHNVIRIRAKGSESERKEEEAEQPKLL